MTADADNEQYPELKPELYNVQILFIVLSGLIGTGVFVTDVDALQLAGPGGLMLALGVLGIVTLCVGDTVSHLVQLFPVPNAIPLYVSTFIDPELGWVIGFAYWYAWTSVFATEMLTAATIAQYWEMSFTLASVIFYVIVPLVLLFINSLRVSIFGWLETIGGAIKVVLMLVVAIAIYHVADSDHDAGRGAKPINVGFTNNEKYATDAGTAFCLALPLVAWGFGGIESTAMAAFEARPTVRPARHAPQHNAAHKKSRAWPKLVFLKIWPYVSVLGPKAVADQRQKIDVAQRETPQTTPTPEEELDDPDQAMQQPFRDIAWASSSVHWITLSLYLFYNIAIALTVPWDYLPEPSIFTQSTNNIDFGNSSCGHTAMAIFVPFCNNTVAISANGTVQKHLYQPHFANFVNFCLLYSVISCGNTALYLASRTFYGLVTADAVRNRGSGKVQKITRTLGTVLPASGVPMNAVVISFLIFLWVPLMSFKDNEQWVVAADIKQFLFVTGSMAYIIVWAGICGAFLRFRSWSKKCGTGLGEDFKRFSEAKYGNTYRRYVRHTRLPQPLAAWIGLAGCLLLVIASTSVWWRGQAKVSKAWTAGVIFLEPFLLMIWLLLKLFSRNRSWKFVQLDSNPSVLEGKLAYLMRKAKDGVRRAGHSNELVNLAVPPGTSNTSSTAPVLRPEPAHNHISLRSRRASIGVASKA